MTAQPPAIPALPRLDSRLRRCACHALKHESGAAAQLAVELAAQVEAGSRTRGATAALEAAMWDAEAKEKGVPLSKLLGGVREEIASGVSIGIKNSLDELAAAVSGELAAGYQRIKIKIKPGKDVEQVKRIRQDFPRIKLMVDATELGSLRLEAIEALGQMGPAAKEAVPALLQMPESVFDGDPAYSTPFSTREAVSKALKKIRH